MVLRWRWRARADPVSDHGQAVWRAIVRVLGDDGEDAADCFQQAFAAAAEKRARGEAIGDLAGFLRHVAIARSIDCVRRRVRDRARHQTLDHTALTSDGREAAATEMRELLDDLRVALTELPPAQASAFVLTQIEDLPREAAAQTLGITNSHLNVLLHRARATLRERLNSHRPVREAPSR